MPSRRRKTCKTASSGKPFAAVLLPTLLTTGSRIFAFPAVRRIFRALCKDIGLVSLAARRATLDGVHHSIISSPTQRYGSISLQGAVRRVTDGTRTRDLHLSHNPMELLRTGSYQPGCSTVGKCA